MTQATAANKPRITQLTPPPNQTAKQEEEVLKATFSEVTPGAIAECPPTLRDTYLHILAAKSYWEDQHRLVMNQIRRHLGNAQVAACNGEPFAKRSISPRAGYTVPPTEVDMIRPSRTR